MTDTLDTENIQMSDASFDFDVSDFGFDFVASDFDSTFDCGVSLILPVCTICRAGV